MDQTTTPAAASIIEDPAPVVQQRRIDSLDVLRGFAVLGILVMNIQSFGLPMAAYSNPTVAGGFTGINYWTWVFEHLLANLKFISIFSMLFGAGVILFTSRIEARGCTAAGLHYRRMGWLLLIGAAHGYLLWYGDILFIYAVCGMFLYLVRHWSPRRLIIAAAAALLITAGLTAASGARLAELRSALAAHNERTDAAESLEPAGDEWPESEATELLAGVTVAQAREQVEKMRDGFNPPQSRIDAEIKAMTGPYVNEIAFRAPVTLFVESFVLLFYGWRIISLMLLGMALFKWGVLSARCSTRLYAAMAILGFAIGLPLTWIGLQRDVVAGFDFIGAKFFNSQFNYFGSIPVALGYVGLIMLLCRSGVLALATSALAAVGRMALTNYLMHTIVCTTIFNGRSGLGLGLFGQLSRSELLIIVGGLFAFQLVASPIWLRCFRFGPFEWLWRSLTYWKLQPMRK